MKEHDGKREQQTRETFRGLVYVKIGRIGLRSEGPDYFLQTAKEEVPLRYERRNPWEPDYHLEFYGRRMVKVTGSFDDKIFVVGTIHEIASSNMPRLERAKLSPGASTEVGDLAIRLSEIKDSRCPTGAMCIRAGEAIVSLWAKRGPAEVAERFELTLDAGRPESATRQVLGARFTLIAVEPHPTVGTTTDPKQQIVTLEVEEL